MSLSNILKGISGEFELVRVLGAAGVAVYIIGANGFEFYQVFYNNTAFDIVSYCAAFPTGLGIAIAAVAGAASVKDRNIAVAKSVQDNGVVPIAAPPPVAAPLQPPINASDVPPMFKEGKSG